MKKTFLVMLIMAPILTFGQGMVGSHKNGFTKAVRSYLLEKEMEMPDEILNPLFLEFDSSFSALNREGNELYTKVYEQQNLNYIVSEYMQQFEDLNEVEPIVKSYRSFTEIIKQLASVNYNPEKASGEKAFGILEDFFSNYANLLIQIDPKNPVDIYLNNSRIPLTNPLPKDYFNIVVHAGKVYNVRIRANKKEYVQKGIKLKAEEKKMIKYKL